MTGKMIDSHAIKIRATVKALKATITKLRRQGVLHAFPHFRPGTRKMFLKESTDAAGKRRYHYVGVGPKAQKKALEKIERYHRATAGWRDLNEAQRRLEGLSRDLLDLQRQYRSLEEWVGGAAMVAATPKKGNPMGVMGDAAELRRASPRNPIGVTGSRGPGRDRVTLGVVSPVLSREA